MTLKEYLADKDYQAFADRMKVHLSTVYRWCNGDVNPPPSQINAIEEATGNQVTYYDFYPKAKTKSDRSA